MRISYWSSDVCSSDLAARSLMIEHGLLEVSIAEISQRAGTNVALVSYYFGNREGLMVAIAENDAERATVNLDRLLAADIAPTATIVAHIKGLIEKIGRAHV